MKLSRDAYKLISGILDEARDSATAHTRKRIDLAQQELDTIGTY